MSMKSSPFSPLDSSDRARAENERWHAMQPLTTPTKTPEPLTPTQDDIDLADAIADLLKRRGVARILVSGNIDLIMLLATYRLRHSPAPDKGEVSREIYEAAVKGRQDFRASYRKLLPVLRAAETICRLWRSPIQPFQVADEFADAVNALDVAVTGGGAKPEYSLAQPAAQPSGDAVLREALEKIAALTPHPELDEGDPGQRCRHCGYRRKLSEPMEHGPHCAYVIASAALASPPVETGEG